MISPYMNPEQAALMSKAGAMHPSLRCKMQAVEGVMKSCVMVATRTRSTSLGSTLARLKQSMAAK
jgi:hypothetical protein